MGERLNDGAGHGRRRARPDDAVADPSGLEALLARALRAPGGRPPEGSDGEQRAVAAFRAALDARDAGDARARRVRTRRRDDWRPRARRHTARSLRVTLCALIAGLALGGAAFAAIGSGTGGGDGIGVGDGGVGRPRQSAGTTTGPSGTLSAVPSVTGDADRDRPAKAGSAKDAAARCRAYEKARGRGDDLGSTAWQRLVTAAGGENNVEAYCAAPGRRTTTAGGDETGKDGGSHKAGGTAHAGKDGKNGKNGKDDKAGESGGTAEGSETAEGGGAVRSGESAEPGNPSAKTKTKTKTKAQRQDAGAGNGG